MTGLRQAFVIVMAVCAGACTTTQVSPELMSGQVPAAAALRHPAGYSLIDLRVYVLVTQKDPHMSEGECDRYQAALFASVKGPMDRISALRNPVREEPEKPHWCFFLKLWKLDEVIGRAALISQAQKELLQAYQWLIPVARAFQEIYQDPRYLRWATHYYQTQSYALFNRKTELNPQGVLDLIAIPDAPHSL